MPLVGVEEVGGANVRFRAGGDSAAAAVGQLYAEIHRVVLVSRRLYGTGAVGIDSDKFAQTSSLVCRRCRSGPIRRGSFRRWGSG